MQRKKTFTGAVLSIVTYALNILVAAINCVITVIALGAIAGAATGAGADGAAVGIVVVSFFIGLAIGLALDIICLVLACKCIKISKMSVQDYAAKRNVVNACFVINIIVVVLGVLSLFTNGFDISTIFSLILWAMLIVAAVFFKIDINANKKEVEAAQAQVVAEGAAAETKAESDVDKLAELNKMKANGLITDEEFEKMKKDLMK